MLIVTLALLAPIVPFLAENMWKNLSPPVATGGLARGGPGMWKVRLAVTAVLMTVLALILAVLLNETAGPHLRFPWFGKARAG